MLEENVIVEASMPLSVGTFQGLIVSPSNSYDDGWLAKIRREVYKNSNVEDVYVTLGEDVMIDYWIIIAHRDIPLVRDLMQDQREHVVDLFSRTEHPPFQVDFHIYYREGRNARDLVPDRAIRIPHFTYDVDCTEAPA